MKNKGWPAGFPHGEYRKADKAGKDELRKKYGMKRLNGADAHQAANHAEKPRRKPAITINEGRWGRNMEGAIQFIRDWNKAKSGAEFMEKFHLDKAAWAACAGRAASMRKKDVPMKEHAIEGSHIKYDWAVLRKAAEEVAD